MSESTNVTRALKRVPLPSIAYYSSGQAPKYDDRFYAEQEASLSAAGLLRTEADRLNAELADAMVALRKKRGCFNVTPHCVDKDWRAMCVALDAVHEHRNPKPVERWTLFRSQFSTNESLEARLDGKPQCYFPPDAEPEARAYVARKNAEEAERAK